MEARYNNSRCCLADTRKEIISTILEWASKEDEDRTRVFWLYGLAGVGKTTIATSVSRVLNERRWLGGSFFFSRDVALRNKPNHLFSTIAFQMASIHPSITTAICVAIATDIDIGRSAVVNQFEELVQKPLLEVPDIGHPVIILLDALDECGTEKEREELLSVIRKGLLNLPHFVKFVITSRPDADINALVTSMRKSVLSYELHTRQKNVDEDIKAFISTRMEDIARKWDLPDDWPGDRHRQQLVDRAAGLFIWASTTCEFVEDEQEGGPEFQLGLVLRGPDVSNSSPSPWRTLDYLYMQVLRQAAPENVAKPWLTSLRHALGAIIVAADPLSPEALSKLLDFDREFNVASPGKSVRDILRKLRSVMIIPRNDSGPLRIIHPSFKDFLTTPSRCTDERLCVNLAEWHLKMAKRCLIRMHESLRRDICRLGVKPIMNDEIPEICITEYIPEDLQYSCRFWAEHIHRSSVDELYNLIYKFAFDKLLCWMEVMSILRVHDVGIAALILARTSLQVV